VTTFSKKLINDVLRYRKKHNISQSEFAHLVGSSQQSISHIEADGNLPVTPVVDKIHTLLYGGEHLATIGEPHQGQYNFVRWLQDILNDEIPYEKMIQILHDAIDAEWGRVIHHKSTHQKDAHKKNQASGASQ